MQTLDNASKNQYIFMHAPAGYGKTISALLWLKSTGRNAVWISLDVYDNTPVLFYRLLCMSMLAVIPHDGELMHKVRSSAFDADPVENTIDLITRLDYDSRYTLVLDDFHLITSEEIKKSLPFVLKRLPLAVTVLILSRNGLPASFAHLKEQQKLSVIGDDALAFTQDEIRKHFAGYGRFITREEAEKVRSVTEGWVIALNTIATSGNIDVEGDGPSRSFNGYIENNIWNKLEDDVKEFLLVTSVPDKFTVELCRHLTGDPGCGAMLDGLIGSSINISLMGTEYRYHNLFLEFLREKLDQSSLDRPLLNKRVAEYYLMEGDILTAKNYAMKSRDAASIAQTVRGFYSLKTFSLDEYFEFHKHYGIRVIPDAICQQTPILYVPMIFYSYAIGDIDNVCRYFDKLYPLIPRIAETNPEAIEHVNGMVMLDVRLRISELPSRTRALPAITQKSAVLLCPTFTMQLPFLHRCVRDFYELLDPALRRDIHGFSSNIIKENVDLMFHGAEAGLLMEQNRLTGALAIAEALKKTVTDDMSAEFVYGVYLLTAELNLQLRRISRHDALMKEVREYISAKSSQYLLKNVAAYEARIRILDGDRTAAEKWLQNYYVDESSFGELFKVYRNFTTARAFILLGLYDKAEAALSRLKTLAESFDRPLDATEADVLLSVVDWMLGKKKDARSRLHGTLPFLNRHGFVRVVAGEGKAVLPILTAVIKQLEREETDDSLLKLAREIYFAAYEQAKHYGGITHYSEESRPVQLSPQQKRVLELLAKGYKNAGIVAETGLSLNTIRTHTKLAYQKLEVNTSADAVLRARELGLIK
jgi:LuxR family maltose regulon positive regulatory protein